MSDAVVWEGDIAGGMLPPICIVTGDATSGTREVRFQTTPSWVILLLFVGVLPYVIVWLVTRRIVTGRIPLSPRGALAVRRRHLRVWCTCLAAFAGVAAATTLAYLVNPDGATPAFAFSLVAALIVCFVASRRYCSTVVPGHVGEPTPWGRSVRLSAVNPTFAAAVQQMYALRDSQLRGAPPMVPAPPPVVHAPPPP